MPFFSFPLALISRVIHSTIWGQMKGVKTKEEGGGGDEMGCPILFTWTHFLLGVQKNVTKVGLVLQFMPPPPLPF